MTYLGNITDQCLNSKYFFGLKILVFINLILLCGDIEENPRPKPKSTKIFSVCHWDVKSIPFHNFFKKAIFESFAAMHKFAVICMYETFLNNTSKDKDLT